MAQRLGIQAIGAHLLWAGVSALLLGLAFAPVGWGWLAHIALVPVTVLALRSAGGWRLVGCLYLVSAIWWLTMLRWIIPVTEGGYIALSLYMAVYLPAAMLLMRWLDRRLYWPATFTLPAVWVTLEMIRGYILAGGFGWYALAHSQAPFLPEHGVSHIIQIADLFGEHGVSVLVALTNGLAVDLLTRPLFGPRDGNATRMHGTAAAGLAVWAAALTATLLYGQWRINQFESHTHPGPVVAVVQTNVPQDNKVAGTLEERLADWQQLKELTRRAAQAGATLIVWPETVTPAPINPEAAAYYRVAAEHFDGSGHTVEATMYRQLAQLRTEIAELARELGVAIVVGSATEDYNPYRRYNSAYLVHADGTIAAERFDKIHRVPFGEYLPWVEWFPWLKKWFIQTLTPYDFDYTLQRGESWTVFRYTPSESDNPNDSIAFVTPICFEDTVPRVIRRLIHGEDREKDAQMLVNLTNDGWFAASSQPLQHIQIAVFRSVENRVPTARAVNTGVSGFIDSLGRVGPVVQADGRMQNIEGFSVHTLRLDERQTLFGRWGYWPALLLVAATAAMLLVAFLRRSKMTDQDHSSVEPTSRS